MLGQFVTATVSVAAVLLVIDCVRFSEDVARDLLVVAGRSLRRVGMQFGPIDGDHGDIEQSRLPAQLQHRAEHA
jgi:hypothetical protein